MSRPRRPALDHFLFHEPAGALDRYEALSAEDDAARVAEYAKPDPKRRRLRVACNDCDTPWCCNQRVDTTFVEALVLYRWAAENVPAQLDAALRRAKELLGRKRRPEQGWVRVRGVEDDDDVEGAEHFQRRQPCPFLVRNKCSVYAVRPRACRVHYMAGNPQKCRNELQPRDTYEMSPDHGILAEQDRLDDDVRFFGLLGDQKVKELSQLLLLIDGLGKVDPAKRWTAPRPIDWPLVAASAAASSAKEEDA